MILPKLYKNEYDENVIKLIDKLATMHQLEFSEYKYILDNIDESSYKYLVDKSRSVTNNTYGNGVFIRALIEISNICKQECNYCGIRASNKDVSRYHLNIDEILECAKVAYDCGFRSFVLQGGEDPYYTKELVGEIIAKIKHEYSDAAVTLSIGERSFVDYEHFYKMGADRFLLRHETASKGLYEKLHPVSMSFDNRMQCINNLKEIGFQTGVGLMVNSPFQTNDDLAEDLMFIERIKPDMCGIGPYITHDKTPLAGNENGKVEQTVVMVALVRLMHPNCLLPATTALGTISNYGRNEALKAGANVLMLNVSPVEYRKNYEIYQNKKIVNEEAAEYLTNVKNSLKELDLEAKMVRGDSLMEGYNVYK